MYAKDPIMCWIYNLAMVPTANARKWPNVVCQALFEDVQAPRLQKVFGGNMVLDVEG